MYFTDWDVYEVTILFWTWHVTTKTQFAFSWFTILLSAAFYHFLRSMLYSIESEICQIDCKHTKYQAFDEEACSSMHANAEKSPQAVLPAGQQRYTMELRVKHAVLNAFTYMWALLLMLVAMTYNTWLFIALVLGYGIGDFVFTLQSLKKRGLEAECH